MSYPSPDSRPDLLHTSVWSCIWSTAQCVLAGGALLVGFAVFVPLEQFDSITEMKDDNRSMHTTRNYIRSFCLSGDGKQAWVVRYPSVLQCISLEDGDVTFDKAIGLSFNGGLQPTAAMDGAVVYRTDHAILLQPIQSTGEPLIVLDSDCDWISASPMHDLLAVVRKSVVELWSITSRTRINWKELEGPVGRVLWSPDGHRLLVILHDGSLQVLAAENLSLQHGQNTDMIGGGNLIWAANGNHAATFNPLGGVNVWDLKRGHVQKVHAEPAYLYSCALAPDGTRIAITGPDGQIWLIDADDGAQKTTLGTASSLISALCFSAEGTSLLVGCVDGRVECWSVVDGTMLWSLDEALAREPSTLVRGRPIPTESPPAHFWRRASSDYRGVSWTSIRS